MYRLNEEKMFFDMSEDQAIVIDSTSGTYYAMNMLASHVFEYLTQGASVEALAEALKQLPDCPDDILVQMESFVARLLACDIVLPDETNAFDGVIEAAPLWFMEGCEFVLDGFQDMTDLIMADPVHDVDVEFGWPMMKEDEEVNE